MPVHAVRRLARGWLVLVTGLLVVGLSVPGWGMVARAAEPRLELRPGAHVSLIGNTLADRMQHDGWLETVLQVRFPSHELVIRNLGFSGDELELRLRSAGFGSPDEHLAKNQTDVVLAFFGYNESFAGSEGLAAFRTQLAGFIEHTKGQKYNGQTPPQVVIFSPLAHEDLGDRNLSNGRENNARLALYAEAMRDVAAAQGVPFVDLFGPSQSLYVQEAEPLTTNGIHLNDRGQRLVAEVIERALLGTAASPGDERLESVRAAVREKNFTWYNRYRTVDGYSIFGGRADLKFVDDQTNREVMQRELEVLDGMTANRDRVIWARAQGRDEPHDDSNLPPFIPVKTNKPGTGPNGEHLYLSGEAAVGQMSAAANMQVNLVASEEQFPELINPVQMSFDTRGRLWVAVWPTYPHWKPGEPMNDKLLIVEDDDHDGRADRIHAFADDLHCPTGFEFWGGGVLVAMAPDLLFLKDTDGDDKADVRVRLVSGLDTADTHHAANSFTLDPAGALYFQEGTFHHTQVESPYGPPVRCVNAGVFRFEPRTQKFEVYVTHGFANPHGHVFDRWGQDFVYDGTMSHPYHGTLFSGHLDFPQKHPMPPLVYKPRTRPCPGVEILSSRHFPDELQGNLLVGNVIGFQGILQYQLRDDGSSFAADEVEPIVSSQDPNFRPSDFEIGPDGALWFTDWQNPVIGHMQHNLRDPSRDKSHGRVYRVTYPSRPLNDPPRIAGAPVADLLALLHSAEDRVRYRTRIELGARDTDEVMRALDAWLAGLDPQSPEREHARLEGLWLRANHNVVDEPLLRELLKSPDYRVRAAATRVLSNWRERVSGALDLLRELAVDEHPRVRLEAVRAASFFPQAEAVSIPLAAARHPGDQYLDYVRAETLKALEPHWKQAFATGQPLATDEADVRLLLEAVPNADLLAARRTPAICRAIIERRGLTDDQRREALAELARLEQRPAVALLLEQVRRLAGEPRPPEGSLWFDLARLLMGFERGALAASRDALADLGRQARLAPLRQMALAGLVTVDGATEPVWNEQRASVAGLADLAGAMPFLKDLALRAELAGRIEPLLQELPEGLAATPAGRQGTWGRFVRVQLPERGTLTLAEVEVYSDGRNIARQGTATQVNTGHGGDAARAIDGNTSGNWGEGGQTHTVENTGSPWWEVDLGAEYPLESLVIFNRTDAQLGQRLSGFSLIVLDAARQEVWRRDGLPAPAETARWELGGGDPVGLLRRSVMNALAAVPGREAAAFLALAPFVRSGNDRPSAIRALLAIPTQHWPAAPATELLPGVLDYLASLPEAERTNPAALDARQLGEALAALLPPAEAAPVRKRLRELGVHLLRVATVPDRMLFDKDVLAVEAGKQVEIVFDNTDIMPHNFVVARPGTLEAVGVLAESLATQPGAMARHYVPETKDVLIASRLLQPRDSQRIRFLAPAKPGIYPYVCTYPGHWRRMYGALYVVADLDGYLADPTGYLAANPLEAADPLLKSSRPRTEWKLADLLPLVDQAAQGRSFEVGKQVFQAANCVACHRLNGTGLAVGPDLAKLDPSYGPAEILQNIVDPSAKINEKFASTVLALDSGRVITGLVIEENPRTLKVLENPLAQAEPLEVSVAEIEHRELSKTSLMPLGMVDRLTREEILDLLAYLIARGDPHHPAFGGHEHH